MSFSDDPPVALAVAGSDSGGGAGIQADLKAMASVGVHGCTAITALTAQNSLGVQDVHPVPPDFVGGQIQSVTDDFGIEATKTGMIFSEPIIREIVSHRDRLGQLVVDPVMFAASGDPLLEDDAEDALAKELIPQADIVTPNWPEAQRLTRILNLDCDSEPEPAGRALAESFAGPDVLIKGGHIKEEEAVDYLVNPDGSVEVFSAPRIDTKNTHGAGCAYSSLITGLLTQHTSPREAVKSAKSRLTDALRSSYACGQGAGTLNFLDQ
jgi:hydroxymethylpyrimidine kinase/phosphomethylpyrimidine kinase